MLFCIPRFKKIGLVKLILFPGFEDDIRHLNHMTVAYTIYGLLNTLRFV
jgi:hypothetical protein